MRQFLEGFFTPEPGVIDGILGLSLAYVLIIGPLRKFLAPGESTERSRVVSFFVGVVILILAVATPLDSIGEKYLFSVHMIQHVLLLLVLPPFLIYGCPPWLANFLFRTEGLGVILRFLVHPVVACVLFNATLLFWHIPFFYEIALRDSLVHLLEHVCFVAAGVFMFWPLFGRSDLTPKLNEGLKLLYILAVNIGQIPLFAFLTFATTVFYPTYEAAPRITDLTPLQDQILGGVIMKLAAGVFMFGGVAICFYRWNRESRR